MHGFLERVDNRKDEAKAWGYESLQQRSHGESFLAVLRHRFNEQGVYFLDEPEAALSFHSCLGLLVLLDKMRREGSQILVATHSPLLVTLPGATLLELNDSGIHRVECFERLDLVQQWRAFLTDPEAYYRHLFEP